MKWIVDVVLKSLLILFISSLLTGGVMYFIECHKFIHIMLTTLISLCFTLPMIYFLGLTLNERGFIKQRMMRVVLHKSR